MEEMINSARSYGFTTWGFTPHGPLCMESPCNMSAENVAPFLQEIKRLRTLYPDIQILAGMEVDFIDEEHGPASPEVRKYGLDYVVGSVHFIPNQRGEYFDIDGSPERFKITLHDHFEDDLEYVGATYWRQIERMINAGGFDIIGHIDKIALNASYVDPTIEQTPLYEKLADNAIEKAIQSGKAIEINTKHFKKYGRFFPHPRYWRKIIDAGIDMPINSDAHYADKVEDGIREAEQLMKTMTGM